MSISKSTFLEFLEDNFRKLEHARNRRGKTWITCDKCSGSGNQSSDSYYDYIYIQSVCFKCNGAGGIEVDCDKSTQIRAIHNEIALLQQKIQKLESKV
jgi:DnaJ-class molecular chaperone